jgi:hypothetical protein
MHSIQRNKKEQIKKKYKKGSKTVMKDVKRKEKCIKAYAKIKSKKFLRFAKYHPPVVCIDQEGYKKDEEN